MSDLIRPGGAPHYCDRPRLNLTIRHGARWRCECRRRWQLYVKQLGEGSWMGEWKRYGWRWPWSA